MKLDRKNNSRQQVKDKVDVEINTDKTEEYTKLSVFNTVPAVELIQI